MRVILNAGHHNTDPGAIVKGFIERDECKKIRDFASRFIREYGIEVMEVPDDLDLRRSIDFTNIYPCDLALDIHLNNSGSVPKGESGVEVYGSDTFKSRSQAGILSQILANHIGLPDRGWKSQTTSVWGSLGWISQIIYPSYLIECLYLSSPADRRLIENKEHDRIGKGIALAVRHLLSVPPKTTEDMTTISAQNKILELSAKVVALMQLLLKNKK